MRKKAQKAARPAVFRNLTVVLVDTQSAGNVGSVARAMKNTGFSGLALVNPCEYRNNEGFSMACKAHDVLLGAREFAALDGALDGAAVVVGTTRRRGRMRYPILTLQEAAGKIVELASENRVALLFGREDKGLGNDAIRRCDMLVEIPASEEYGSMNISHAAMLVLYHLFAAAAYEGPSVKAAGKAEVEAMYAHLESAMRALGYGERGGEYLLQAIMRSFRRLFGRTALMQKEVNMLRGISTQIEERVRRQ